MALNLDFHTFSHSMNPVVAINHMDPQNNMGMHTHDFSELVLVVGGRGVHNSGKLEYEISARDVFVVPQGQAHAYQDCRNLELINLLYKENMFDIDKTDITTLVGYHALFRIEPEMMHDRRECHMKVSPALWRRLMKMAGQIEDELSSRRGGFVANALAYLTAIMVEISRAYPGERIHEEDLTPKLAKVFTYIEDNLHRRITTPMLAEVANMSLSTLQRHFSVLTGETLTMYITRLRIDRAADLLRETDLSITDIAFNVGFEDSNYFSKTFRKFKGVSPSRYS